MRYFGAVSALMAVCGVVGSVAGQVGFPEAEPDDSKARAVPVLGMLPGDFITGTTTGSSTTVAGSTSADYFLIRTAAAPLDIYRYRLVITTTGTAGHSGTIRGLTVTDCQPNAGTDTAIQNSASNTSPPRMDQWYGFGKEERVYWRVTGTSSTTQPYTATLSRDVVTPAGAVTLTPGAVTIEAAPGNTTDLDMAVYDFNFSPVPGYSNDGSNRLVRTFAPGRYYVAVCPRNLANDQPCPPDDTWRIAGATDFPDCVVSFTNIFPQDLSLQLTHPYGVVGAPMTFAGAFDVNWLIVDVLSPPLCSSDFNNDGDSGTDADIQDFFACLGGNCCPTCGTSDFNNDGDFGTDADIEAFFRVLGGGGC